MSETLPGYDELAARARSILEAHWQPEGYTVPNLSVYPHQWLWDSCFHAIIWAHLGEGERALAELRNVFVHQADDGFIPHMTYWREPTMHEDFWGRAMTSSITQPPMYGHAIAELVRLGVAVDAELIERAVAGLEFLFEQRAREEGALVIVHPWETGCDNSPRWDAWCPGGFDTERWRAEKGRLVSAVRHDPVSGAPVASDRFEVESAAFNSLVVFNARELATAVGSKPARQELQHRSNRVSSAVRGRWDANLRTFVDRASPSPSRDARSASLGAGTLEALLPVLDEDPHDPDLIVASIFEGMNLDDPDDPDEPPAANLLFDAAGFGGACGPAQVLRSEPSFDPSAYWRGASWPQLTYLFWVAATRAYCFDEAGRLRDSAIRGAVRSGFAEYWHPDTGEGFGAVPQSWTGLVAIMAKP